MPPRVANIVWKELGRQHRLSCRELGVWDSPSHNTWVHIAWLVTEYVMGADGTWQPFRPTEQVKEIRQYSRFEEAKSNPKEKQPVQLTLVAV